ncbi:MAG TPA: DinB family protein [Micrococcaceae bacterium]|jgi:hypothetical protein
MDAEPLDRTAIAAEYRRACADLEGYLSTASDAGLRGNSRGTSWSNEELLFHMVFGFMIVRALLPLVRLFGGLPASWNRDVARLLNAATRPFDVVNYLGSKAAAKVFNRRRMAARMRRTTAALAAKLAAEPETALARGMDFPTRWDPFFKPRMTLADVYAYPVLHFDFHARQLDL